MLQMLEAAGNPSSPHAAGREARAVLELSRTRVAGAIGLPSEGSVVFTSGGTEANHLALCGTGRPVIRSAIEHDSVRAACVAEAVVPVDCQSRLDLEALERALSCPTGQKPALVSLMAANNETGVIQPIAEAAMIAHAAGALVHCDAVQAFGKIRLDMAALGIDLLSLSAHKVGGPPGAGALAIAEGVALQPLQRGGGQEAGLRAGTENLIGIAGFGAAAEAAALEIDTYAELASLRDRLEAAMLEIAPVIVLGAGGRRLPNTSCVALPGVGAAAQLIALDLAGICVGAGAACSTGKVSPSHVLAAMGVAPDLAGSAIRISLGRTTTAEDVGRCVAAWQQLAVRATARAAAQ